MSINGSAPHPLTPLSATPSPTPAAASGSPSSAPTAIPTSPAAVSPAPLPTPTTPPQRSAPVNHHHFHHHHHVTFPTLASLIRLLPLSLLFFLTTPHTLAEHIHAIYTRGPYLKPSPLDPFPSQYGDVTVDTLPLPFQTPLQRHHIVLPPGTSFYASLRPPAQCTRQNPCSVLLETWYDTALPRELKPDPYFLAANGDVPQPFPRFPAARLADDEAFFTWRPYHYLQLPNVVAADHWHARILNHDSIVFNTLNASFRVTVVPSNNTASADPPKPALCPRGPSKAPCSGRGSCTKGQCQCHPDVGGRYCETNITDLPSTPIEVAPDTMRVFRYRVPHQGSVATVLRLQAPQAVSSAAHPILFAKRLGANGGRQLREGPPLPSLYDMWFTDVAAVHAHWEQQQVITSHMRAGDLLYIGVYNFHVTPPAWLARRHRTLRAGPASGKRSRVHVVLSAFSCIERVAHGAAAVSDTDVRSGLPLCPPRTVQTWKVSLRFLLGPLVLGFLMLMTMVVCVSVWAGLFRQQILETMTTRLDDDSLRAGMHHGGLAFSPYGQPRRDKLSEVEVNAMFPAFEFTKVEVNALCAVGDASCSVCLCSFEEREMLRRLACGHSYHSECLDQWLLTNATCPRCRKSARIRMERLASGGVVILQRVARWGISRLNVLGSVILQRIARWGMLNMLGSWMSTAGRSFARHGVDGAQRDVENRALIIAGISEDPTEHV